MMVLGLSYRKMEAGNRVLEEIVREIGDELSADGIQARHAWSSGNSIAEDVLEQAATSRTDMVVVTSALDVSSKQYFIGPNAQKIIGNAKVPVLSIRKVNVAIMA